MSQQRRKKHHIVPQFVLQNFADQKGDIHEFDLDLLRQYRLKPAQVAHATDFYTIDTKDGPSDAVERFLAEIESAASEVVRKLAVPGATLNSQELDSLVLLVALQAQRVSAKRVHMTDFIDRSEAMAMHLARSYGLDPEEATAKIREEMAATRDRTFMNQFLLRSLEPTFRLMRRRGWAILRTHDDSTRFVIADNPVVITDLREETGPPYFPLIPYGEDSKISMPISAEATLVSYFDPKTSKEAFLPPDLVGHCNFQQLLNADRRIYGSQNDFTWGNLGERDLRWNDYVIGQKEARAEQEWESPHIKAGRKNPG